MSMTEMILWVHTALSERRGATAIEYGLIAAGISVAIALITGTIGGDLATTFGFVSEQLQAAQ